MGISQSVGGIPSLLWRRGRPLLWLPIVILLLPLALGQGWIGEVVMILLPFLRPPAGIAYFVQPSIEPTRVLNALPFAVALLTPWPEWVIAVITVVSWLLAAAATYRVAMRLFPDDRAIAVAAFFIAGTSAYDLSLLQAAYLPLFLGALLHWTGFLAMLVYCDTRARSALAGSALLQMLSLFTYATAVGAIAVGPLVAYAFVAMKSGRKEALRPAATVAAAWWPSLAAYLAALAWVATRPNNYITSLGGLRVEHPGEMLLLAASLIAENFNVVAWLHPGPLFGAPPRVVAGGGTIALSAISTLLMLLFLIGALRDTRLGVRLDRARWLIATFLIAIVASNAATALVKAAESMMRTHLVSRLYASVVIAACCVALLQSRRRVFALAGVMALVSCLAIGAWTVADRADYLVSIWPRQRTELRSLDAAIRRIKPEANIVLYVPSGVGYIATVAPWHARPWSELIRGPDATLSGFALWSPDRGSVCNVVGTELQCQGDLQPFQSMPVDKLVVLRYDAADCQYKVLEGTWLGPLPSLIPPGYMPSKWIQEPPPNPSELVRKLLYGPRATAGAVNPADPCRA